MESVIKQPLNAANLYIISGCNGAGKTTASYTVLPEILDCREFVNADEIARGLSPFNPESVSIEAGRLMLQRIEYLLNRNISFSIIYDNTKQPRQKVASYQKGALPVIANEELYKKLIAYVK